jgi:opacity protein-like surface antigen
LLTSLQSARQTVIPTIAVTHAIEFLKKTFRGQRRDIRSSQEIALKQGRAIPIVRSVVVLGLVSAGLTRSAVSQAPQAEEPASSSRSQTPFVASALFAPMLPDAPGFATPTTAPVAARHRVETSVSLGGSPQLTATRIENGSSGGFITQSLHPSANIVATFRQSFRPWLGYSVNVGYTRAAEHNTNGAGASLAGTYSNFYVPNNVWELSLSHVAQKHLTHRLTVFTDEGAGFMAFQPAQRGSTFTFPGGVVVGTNFRPLIVFGAGADYRFNPQWALRGEYRGLLYKFPDYGQSIPRLTTITSEPAVSLTYTFGRHTYKQ